MKRRLLSGLVLLTVAPAFAAESVPYPAGYRDWYHVKSMVILPGHPLEKPFAGIHHVYANDAARRGLESGHFAPGAVLVFDLLEARQEGHAITEGPRKLVGVMVRDPQHHADTGGWGFEGFAGDSETRRLTRNGGRSCFECHRQAEDHEYVFTRLRD